MSDETPLDLAHANMQAAPDDNILRLAFYGGLADSTLFLLLDHEADGDHITPRLFAPRGQGCVLAFDREDRLSAFTGTAAPYAALPGRTLCEMLAGQDIALGLNLDVAPSSILLSPEAVTWLAQMLRDAPARIEAHPHSIRAPGALPGALLAALDTRLARAEGLAKAAWLVGVGYETGDTGHMLAYVDALPTAQPILARAVFEALRFSGAEEVQIDVSFVRSKDPVSPILARHGLRFDLPVPTVPRAQPPSPGSDPAAPPKLR